MGVLITTLMAAINIWQPTFLVFLNHKAYDSLLRLAGGSRPSRLVAVVNVDEESLVRHGQWPWPHYRLARLINGIKDLGAEAVVLDFMLSEPDRTSLSMIRKEMARDLGLMVGFTGVPDELIDNEHVLAAALARGVSVLGMKFSFNKTPQPPREDCLLDPVQTVRRSRADGEPGRTPWFKASGAVCNIPVLARAVKRQGFLNVGLDSDGVLRRAPLLIEHRGKLFPSLALAAYMQMRGAEQVVVHLSELGAQALQVRENLIPVDSSARLLINYRGSAGTFQPVSAAMIMEGRATREELEGRVVVVGISAAGIKDQLATPLNTGTTGVEVQATLLDNLIQGDYLSSPAYTPGLELGLVILCGLASAWFFGSLRALGTLLFLAGGVGLAAGLSVWSLGQHGLYWSPLWPSLTLAANFSLLNLVRFRREEQRVKNHVKVLSRTVGALREEIEERRRAEEALSQSEERFRVISEESPLGVGLIREDGTYEYVNPAFSRIFGYSLGDFSSGPEWFRLAFPDRDYRRRVIDAWIADQRGSPGTAERSRTFEVVCKDGGRKTILFMPVKLPKGKQFILYEDVTERVLAEKEMRRLEEELYQAQKLEALGVLAGGIAHDFNNVLQAISGFTQMMLYEKDVTPVNRTRLEHIEQSIRRAAKMIGRLMTLARKTDTRREKVDLNWEVKQEVSLLRHTLPKMVTIKSDLDPDLRLITGDPGQLEQVLMNLATNAAHAMRNGGELCFATRNVELAGGDLKTMPGLEPGPYVRLMVRDTGQGMDDGVRSRIFEPFFTTKPIGVGTGLGLSTTFSIVTHHGGHIQCQSRPGQGTVFTIHLPAEESPDEVGSSAAAETGGMFSGRETILLIDDEGAILEACREALGKEGYTVLTAASGEQAMAIVGRGQMEIDLFILDLNMPGMGGRRCLEAVMDARPTAKVLVSTGYADEGTMAEVKESGALDLIRKPYNFRDLTRKIRSLLD